ncbi:MAG: threonine synthase, partial [Boseongicola sp.]|nr:threonine synthase [Boseongicola sp.]
CPHSAVGVHVGNDVSASARGTPNITLATAHPAKFPAAVEAATDVHPPLPKRMSDLYQRSERITRVGNDLSELQSVIRETRQS